MNGSWSRAKPLVLLPAHANSGSEQVLASSPLTVSQSRFLFQDSFACKSEGKKTAPLLSCNSVARVSVYVPLHYRRGSQQRDALYKHA